MGDTVVLKATVLPSEADDKSVKWVSSDAKVATVINGSVKAIAAGTAKITVTTNDAGKVAECTITVNEPEPDPESGPETP